MTALLERIRHSEPDDPDTPDPVPTPEVHSAAGLSIEDTIVTPDYTIGYMVLPGRDRGMHLMWDSRNEAEVAAAASTFATFKTDHYFSYKMDAKGSGEMITKFDPRAERIVLARQVQGG